MDSVSDILTRLQTAIGDRYRIERELGHGGMATVYLALDLRHDRQVAVKVLRPELAAVIGAERFLAEIKTTAALQHPHILPLFDSGEAAGQLFYVMPLIEGESLRDRLIREKQLPIADAVRIASEVAGALDYAHRRGVIHRDIKPENILLHDGRALVADFGIALAASKAGNSRMTETGMSLGTPHYMAPEQAMGEREITARADIYALGCVTYEMLTAEPPFQGATAQAIIARVMTESPRSLTLQRHTIPPQVEAAVLTAIEKLPADRFGTAAEFAAALSGTAERRDGVTAALHYRRTVLPPSRLTVLAVSVAIVATALAAWGWFRPGSISGKAVRRYALELPGSEAVSPRGVGGLVFSPDGSRLAYIGGGPNGSFPIWMRERNQLHGQPLPGTDNSGSLSWSPDGRRIAYIDFADGKPRLRVIGADGSAPETVADSLVASGGTTWGPDGYLYSTGSYGGRIGIVRVPAAGGVPVPVTMIDSTTNAFAHLYPALLPNNRGLLFTIWYGPARPTETEIAVANLKTGAFKVLQRGIRARYLSTGHILIARTDGTLAAVPFDQDRMVTTGPLVPVVAGLEVETNVFQNFDVAGDGSLGYLAGQPGDVREKVQPVWVTRDGRMSAIDTGWIVTRPFNGGLSLSPDGHRLAIAVAGQNSADIWIKQLDHGPLSRLTFEEFLKYRPSWTPDGRSVSYVVDPGNNNASIYVKRADGSGAAQRLLISERSLAEAIWSSDQRWLVVRTTLPTRDILGLQPGVDSTLVMIVASPRFEERAASLSPDGRWIAYQSDESGQDEIYVRPFPKADNGRWQISAAGGSEPLWGRSGREIFFRSLAGEMMTAPVTATTTFSSSGAPRALFSTKGYATTPGNRAYDVSPDDQRFVMLRSMSDSTTRQAAQLVV
ncbi:MAG: protein kinase, partial [Gemmatimonadota bacterium]